MSKRHFSNPVDQRSAVRVRVDWSGATRRLIAGALGVAVAGSLFVPNVALAAEWVDVGGTQYNAGTAAGDEAGTWAWDGADDMRLNGYDGGAIAAGGKLNVNYSGDNLIYDREGPAIEVRDGEKEQAELTITGGADSTLTAESSSYSGTIKSEGDITIDGAGTVDVAGENGICADGDVEVKGGGRVNVEANGFAAVEAGGDVNVTGTALSAKGGEVGIQGTNVTIDGSDVLASAGMHDAAALVGFGGDVTIRNGSNVHLEAEGVYAYGIHAFNLDRDETGGAIYISDSTVEAIARYNKGQEPEINYLLADGDAEDIAGRDVGMVYGILANTFHGLKPATVVIDNSHVTAAGLDAAIAATAVSRDGSAVGTIKLVNYLVQTPEGGVVCDLYVAATQDNPSVMAGQLIALPGEVLDSIINDDVSKLAVIVPNADKPVGGDEEKPVIKPAEHKVEKTQQVVAKPTPTTAKIPATGDTMANGLAATVLAGITALLGSLAFGRKRS